jgi:hypothetical protein
MRTHTYHLGSLAFGQQQFSNLAQNPSLLDARKIDN